MRAPGERCLSLFGGERVLCSSESSKREPNLCWKPGPLTFSFYGHPFAGSVVPDTNATRAFWAPPSIEDARRPSALVREERGRSVRCGEPLFSPLARAVETWCKNESLKPEAEQFVYWFLFCNAEETSLQTQLAACTDLPACPESRDAIVPSVDRAQMNGGKDLELAADRCSLQLHRRQDGSYLADSPECSCM